MWLTMSCQTVTALLVTLLQGEKFVLNNNFLIFHNLVVRGLNINFNNNSWGVLTTNLIQVKGKVQRYTHTQVRCMLNNFLLLCPHTSSIPVNHLVSDYHLSLTLSSTSKVQIYKIFGLYCLCSWKLGKTQLCSNAFFFPPFDIFTTTVWWRS